MIIFTLLGCALIMLLFTVRFYMKQQKKVMKGQARYDILSEFSDTVLFEYDCLEKTLVFTPNITTLFGLKEIGPIRPFDNDTDFTMVHPDDVAKVKALLSTIGDNSDEIDDFVSNWKLLATQSKELRYYVYTTKTYNRLMNTYGEVCTDLEKPTLRSMRDVESAANMFYYTED